MLFRSKGYDSEADIPDKERMKIDSARQFFKALRDQGLPVQYQTKLNRDGLTQIINQITSDN